MVFKNFYDLASVSFSQLSLKCASPTPNFPQHHKCIMSSFHLWPLNILFILPQTLPNIFSSSLFIFRHHHICHLQNVGKTIPI